MGDHDNGATVRLAATIARSRHEADGGTMLDGIHPDTIMVMALAAKREVDGLRSELAEARAERDAASADYSRELAAHGATLREKNLALANAEATIAKLREMVPDAEERVAIRTLVRGTLEHPHRVWPDAENIINRWLARCGEREASPPLLSEEERRDAVFIASEIKRGTENHGDALRAADLLLKIARLEAARKAVW